MKILQIANVLALMITLTINYLSNTGIFNGNTMASVSSEYQNLFTPAGYAFSIWGFIYLGLLAFIVFQGRSLVRKKQDDPAGDEIRETAGDEAVAQIGWWFVVSCAANCLWILAWLYEYTGLSVLIMLVLLFSLIKIIIRTHMEKTDPPLKTIASVWWPFSLYSGWITVALLANISAYLTKIGWSVTGIPPVVWAIAMIGIAGTVYLLMTWTRNMREFALVGVWALVAVAVANWHKEPIVTKCALIVSLILFVSSGLHGYMNRAGSPWKRQIESPPSTSRTPFK
jgi:hypothetical protein